MTAVIRKRAAAAALLAFACSGVTRAAHAWQAPASEVVQLDAAVASRAGTVTGTVWHRDDSPVRDARLQLRDLSRGDVTQVTQADDMGRFTFSRVAPGNYVVELVDDSGNVLAVGQMFAIGPVETVATFIRIGSAVPWYSGFFSNAAAAALASAATLGVTALGNGGQPASARS